MASEKEKMLVGKSSRVMREITEEDKKYYYKNLKFDES